jgi:hypothetical protein
MKNKNIYLSIMKAVGVLSLIMTFMPGMANAAYYYQANGGSYYTQTGTSWVYAKNDGYCVSGRGPCGSSLWYSQWTYNHKGCGADEGATYKMSAVLPYKGTVAAWVDSGANGGTMSSADYMITYNGANAYYVGANQNKYGEVFMPIASNLYAINHVSLTDAWSTSMACNSGSGYRVEFDEIRLDV